MTIIRPIEEKDAQAVEDMFAQYWPTGTFRDKLSQRLRETLEGSPEATRQKFVFSVAENAGEVVGVLGFRNIPEHLLPFKKTENSAELYVIAVKYREQGIGKELITWMLQELKSLGYTEVVLFSGETHTDSWGFYDRLEFQRRGPATAPDGEPGQVWGFILK